MGALVVGPPVVGLYTWLVEPHWLEITTPVLPIRGLPADLEGRTLAQLSDLHVGPRVSDRYVDDALMQVAERQPDFVVCTGDWITYRGPQQFEQLKRRLDKLPRGRLATLGILGNHDYGFGWRMDDVADEVTAITQQAGVRILRNERLMANGLQFIGLDDLWGPHFAPVHLLADRARGVATLALCHNPDGADTEVWGDYDGWILAGHTHGGQCKPPFLPPPVLPVRNTRYTSGVIPAGNGRTLYISRGIGHLLRVRFNVRPEVPVFTLRRAT